MIAFVDMAHDKRTYRFFQDTRHGRLLIAESQSLDTIVAAVADYVARRLVERERALTVARVWSRGRARNRWKRAGRDLADRQAAPARLALSRCRRERAACAAEPPKRGRRRGFARRLGDALSLFLMLLGAITLALLLGSASTGPGPCVCATFGRTGSARRRFESQTRT